VLQVGRVPVKVGCCGGGVHSTYFHPEDTIVARLLASFFSKSIGPLCRAVAPVAGVCVGAMGVPDLEESVSSGKLLSAKNSVCMAVVETISVLVGIATSRGAKGHHVVGAIVLENLVPQSISSDFIVLHSFGWTTLDALDALHGVASDKMLVVAVELGKALLVDGAPDGLVSTDISKVGFGTIQREVVIDNDSVRDSEGVEVHRIDALSVENVLRVDEKLLDAAFLLSNSGGCGERPAVAKLTLDNIVGGGAITENLVASERLGGSLPLVVNVARHTLVELRPLDGGHIIGEFFVSVDA